MTKKLSKWLHSLNWLVLMPYNWKSTRKLPTHQLANKYELTFKCCCNEPRKCVGSLQNCLQDLWLLLTAVLSPWFCRPKPPRFRRPDFFQDIWRYSHIELITEVTLHNLVIGRIKVNFESITFARNFSSEIQWPLWPVSENWFVYIQNLFSWYLNIPALSILYRIHIDVYSSPAKVGGPRK